MGGPGGAEKGAEGEEGSEVEQGDGGQRALGLRGEKRVL